MLDSEEEDDRRHVQWIDQLCVRLCVVTRRKQKPLVQHTPPLSKPLHRSTMALKPCMDSPDLATKQALEMQRLNMIEQQRSAYRERIERKHARLF